MTAIAITQFNGANRAIEPKLLPEGQGVDSLGQKPGRGDLRGWRTPLQVMTAPDGRQTIYRMGRDVAADDRYWLSWPTVVHAARGFDVEDTSERTLFSGDGAPQVVDNLALSAGVPTPNPVVTRPLGVPAPDTAPQVVSVPKDASDPAITQSVCAYVYTYVTDWGWESAPSPVSVLLDKPENHAVQVSGFSLPPAGNYNVNRLRIYRTQDGAGTGANFFFVGEVSLGAALFVDKFGELGELIASADWLTAPGVPRGGADNTTEPNLSCLTALWNGMLAGIVGKSVRFCEAYTPYAWPMAYDVVPPDGTPVGLGVLGQALLVLTTNRPLLVSGTSPDSMDQQPVEMSQGCIAPRSVVSMGAGVAWASNDGLCWYGAGGPRVLTAGLMTRDDWLALRPQTIIGQMYEGLYFGSYQPVEGGPRKGFLVNPAGGSGVFFLTDGFDAAHFDELQDQLYLLRGTQILKWESGETNLPVSFTSKVYRQPKPLGFACAEVVATAYPVHVAFYADGALFCDFQVGSREPFRLPTGRAMDWQVRTELLGVDDGGVQAVLLAQTMKELAGL